MLPTILQYIQEAEKDFDTIPEARKQTLSQISHYVADQLKTGKKAELIYICTHNSRRSHFGQIWAMTAATYYGFDNVQTYSGGTEATAFNANAIKAAGKAGFQIESGGQPSNPKYTLHFQEKGGSVLCFSKKFDDAANPQQDFCAVMTCAEADGACPFVPGAIARVATPYSDPKAFDNTPQQDEKYEERCKQIATETLYAFSLVKNLL